MSHNTWMLISTFMLCVNCFIVWNGLTKKWVALNMFAALFLAFAIGLTIN